MDLFNIKSQSGGIPAEIQTEYLLPKSKTHYYLNVMANKIIFF
jgi:hypothetical protein